MLKHRDRVLSIFIAIVIITYGVMSTLIVPFYQDLIELMLPEDMVDWLSSIFVGQKINSRDVHNLGRYLIYYPSYLILHLGLIYFLFENKSKSQKAGFAFVLIGIPMTALAAFVFHLLDYERIYHLFARLFVSMVSMPFVLFVVEGGRALDKNIDRLMRQNENRQ